jgi:Domain of unknown function (DUF5615)
LLTLLFDEGLPGEKLATAFRALEIDAWSVGDEDRGAPPKGSSDEVNCEWCAEHKAVLITNDWGRKDKAIHQALRAHGVSAVFVNNALRKAPLADLACVLLKAREGMDDLANRKVRMSRRLRRNGKLENRE